MPLARVNHRKNIHHGRVFEVTVENITLPNGLTFDLEVLRHPGAAAIVPLTEDREVIMLRQYRHAAGRMFWEIPAGTLEAGEAPLACAHRELKEETGYRADLWDDLGAVMPVPGYSDERIQLYLARDLTLEAPATEADEVIEVHAMELDRVVSMITAGEIEDAKTITAIFRLLRRTDP